MASHDATADRNLLFGILALQMGFISSADLMKALNAWVLDKTRSLGQILGEQGALGEDTRALVEALVQKHLELHGQDPQQSLASVAVPTTVCQGLRNIADVDVQASVDSAGFGQDADPGATGLHPSPPQVAEPNQLRPQAAAAGMRYRVLRPHARGGLGEVFVAEDTELERQVALKEIREHRAHEPQSRSRFLLEAKITGGLEHPGIVPVYGRGQYDDGRPYYAMRFIQGETLKEAISRFHAADTHGREPGERTLALRKLLSQFVAVCNAVAYAHSRGVLNRDIKDDNIMLGKFGETLVIDWGLAKVVGRKEGAEGGEGTLRPAQEELATRIGTVLGTPAYMSPEAATGRLDLMGPASDIYSLGATLYKLLTGKVPIPGADPDEVLGKASRGEWLPPRLVKKEVPAALDAICRKAMARRPENRYASALELAAELEHWLADEPVAVYPERWPTRLGRWSRRHKAIVSAAVALLLTAVGGLGIGLVAVAKERGRTQQALVAEGQRRQQARQALDTMSSEIIDEWLGKQKELLPEHKEFLEKARASYEEFARDTRQDVDTRSGVAAASRRVGDIYWKLGQAKEAEAAYQRSADLYALLAADFPDRPDFRFDLAKSRSNLAALLKDTGRPQEAERVYGDVLGLQKQLVAEFPDQLQFRMEEAISHNHLGLLLSHLGRPKEAEMAHDQALALQQQLAAGFPDRADLRQELAESHTNLGNLLAATGRPEQAEVHHRAALALKQKLAADFPKRADFRDHLATSHNNLGNFLRNTGRPKQAEPAYRDALALQKQLADEFPNRPDFQWALARTHNNLATVLAASGRPKEAEKAFRDARAIYKQLVADFPNRPDFRHQLAGSTTNLSILLRSTGRPEQAEPVAREALALFKQLAADFPNMPDYQAELANALEGQAEEAHARHDDAEACRLLEEAQPAVQAALRANPRNLFYRGVAGENRKMLAQARLGLGEHMAAAAAAEEMLTCGADPATDAYNAACLLAQCGPLAQKDAKLAQPKRKELAQSYTDKAIALLRQAVAKGYKDAVDIKKNKDLDPLRSRQDFQKIVSGLEQAAPADKKTKDK
jgi:serine/threonine-protein kinase